MGSNWWVCIALFRFLRFYRRYDKIFFAISKVVRSCNPGEARETPRHG